jgi:hypothetical protein
MVRRKWRELLTAAVAGIVALLSAFPSVASNDEPFRYGLENNNPVFLSREEANKGTSFRLLVKGGTRATIVAELVDLYSDGSGSKKTLPLGSSKFSPKGLISFDTVIAEYLPSEEFQYFDVPFRFTEGINTVNPVLGGMRISVVTEEPETEGFKVQSSIVGTFAYFPTGTKLAYAPALELSQPLVSGMGAEIPPFGMIPDFPFLLNDGKFTVEYLYENTGDIFLETTSDVVLSGPSFLWQSTDQEAFRYSSDKAFVVPNQVATNQLAVAQKVDDEVVVESLPYGVYTLTTSVSGALGSENEVEDSVSQVVVIFPWKYTLFVLILLVAFRKQIKSAAIAAWDLNQSWREFRRTYKMRTPDPEKATRARDKPDRSSKA